MNDKKLTDKEIVKALEYCINNDECGTDCPCFSEQKNMCGNYNGLLKQILDLINRLQAENERLQETIDEQDIEIARLYKEIDRWISAYEQAVRERDIFAEDMKEEIKKDCSYLMLDIKTIKTEAYKEFAEKLDKASFITGYTTVFGGKDVPIKHITMANVHSVLKELVGEDSES